MKKDKLKKEPTEKKTAEKSKKSKKALVCPVLATRNLVPLPGLVIPVQLVKGGSADCVSYALSKDKLVALVLQTGLPEETSSKNNLCTIGGLARIVSYAKLSNGDLRARFHIESRARIRAFTSFEPFIQAEIDPIVENKFVELTKAREIELDKVRENLTLLSEYDHSFDEHVEAAREIFSPGSLADLVASILPLEPLEAQRVLEELDQNKRLHIVAEFLKKQLDVILIKERISTRVESEIGRVQQQEILREQLRQIQAELGDSEDTATDVEDLKEQLAKIKMPAAVKKEAQKQVRRFQQLHPDTSEAALLRTYLDWIVNLPWNNRTKDQLDLDRARNILDEDHYGLEKTKERILDFLGVRKLRKDSRGPILLLVGPPGVGKTSLGRSIARALGRKFIRISVGGLRDEAELRGHRRTYVGAMPGRVIQGIHSAGMKNPVLMIDELDKIGSDFRGDPASVLLEILDPEQNASFEDLYLNLPFDLSEIMFIATANVTDTIPEPLLDRMEIIELTGYTTEEKIEIAKRYIIPREKREAGLESYQVTFNDEAILTMIERYSKESGVRELTRTIATVLRKLARKIAEGEKPSLMLTEKTLQPLLGIPKYDADLRLPHDQVGVVTGLAWTSVGGEILFIEATITKGKGTLSLTGQMGDVMRESAMAALTYVMSEAEKLGIDPNFYEQANVHVHIPKGAIPKDGPSAGVAIATVIVSALTGKPVSRNVAMTGEITLRGNVLPIGGLKEKSIAALRAGIPLVIIPKANEKELSELPEYLTSKVTFATVEHLSEVFTLSLVDYTKRDSARKKTEKSIVI